MPEKLKKGWSKSAEKWVKEHTTTGGNNPPVCEVLVVGSGYGGSFAAREFAKAHHKVWVIERGKEYPLGAFPETLGELPGHLRVQRENATGLIGKADGLLDFRVHTDVSVLVANGLGGGSLINAGVAVLPDESLFTQAPWPSHYRNSSQHQTELMNAARQVQADLQARPFIGAQQLKKFQALKELGKAMQTPIEAVPLTIASEDQCSPSGVAQAACTRCGNCFSGCNVGAKNTLVTHVLSEAVQAGADIYTGLTVLEVEKLASNAPPDAAAQGLRWRVRVGITTEKDSPHQPRRSWWILARTVILSAGALGSTEILLRSKNLATSPTLGSRFSTNGDVLAMGWGMGSRVNGMAREDETKFAPEDRVGPTITGRLRPKVHLPGTDQTRTISVEEGAVPSALTQVVLTLGATLAMPYRYTQADAPRAYATLASNTSSNTLDTLAIPPDLDRHALLLLAMGEDEADGRILLDSDPSHTDTPAPEPRLKIRWQGSQTGPKSPYYEAIHQYLLQASDQDGFQGGNYLPSPLWKPLPKDFQGVAAGLDRPVGLTVHPLGGCPMGDNAETGTVDWRGTVFAQDGSLHEGLHVLDGAMLPTAVGVNPFVTISALSLLAARALVAQEEQAKAKPHLPATAPAVEPRPPHPTAGLPQWSLPRPALVLRQKPLVLSFHEHLQGHWQGDAPAWFPSPKATLTEEEHQQEWIVSVQVKLDLEAWLAQPSMPLAAHMRVFHNPTPGAMSISTDALQQSPWLEGDGTVALLALDAPKGKWQDMERRVNAFRAFLSRRSVADFFDNPPPTRELQADEDGFISKALKKIAGLWRAAGNHAQYRTLDYAFDLKGVKDGVPNVLATGRKTLAYAPGQGNPWDALVQIQLQLKPETASSPPAHLALTVDLIDMVRRQRLQVQQANDTPTAMSGLLSFGAMWLRVLFQTHFWSFPGLSYHRIQTLKPAQHGPLRLENGSRVEPEVSPLIVPRLRPHRPDDIPATPDSAQPTHLYLELTRYIPPSGDDPGRQLLMIHGLAHGASVFSTHTIDGHNMATAFLAAGYTVWLFDHRLSNRLGYATQQHNMDDVAALDIPAAVKHVYEAAQQQPISVFAHCVGGGAFAMATLQGALHDSARQCSRVKQAIIHAVHPWVVPSASNQLSGEVGALYRDWLPAEGVIDPIPPSQPKALDQFLDRMAGSLPWPESELEAHLAHRRDPAAGTATCNRMTLFYGREWVHANLAEATHKELSSLVGPASVEVFRQLYYIVNRQHLTDREGTQAYMTLPNFEAHWTFPILFAHGTKNKVFDPRSAVRSWHQLRRIQEQRAGGPAPKVALFMPEGYGHMDFLFGQHAHRDVYPSLVEFFNDPRAFTSSFGVDQHPLEQAHQHIPSHWQDRDSLLPQQTITGPMLQCRRTPTAHPAMPHQRELLVWVELPHQLWTDDIVPYLVDARLESSSATPLPHVTATRLESIHSSDTTDTPNRTRPHVSLLQGAGQYWVLRWQETPECRACDLPPLALAWGTAHADANKPHQELGRVSLAQQTLKWWQVWASDAPSTSTSTSWLAASCRWPGMAFEQQAIDKVAVQMSTELYDTTTPAQALVLLGDQIYADAVGNLFNLQEADERLAQMYRDAWGRPSSRALFAQVPTYLAVDDHEYRDNWAGSLHPASDATFLNGFEATFAYQWRWNHSTQHQPVVQLEDVSRSRSSVRGFWQEFQIGDLPAFAVDTRSERLPAPQQRLFSRSQMRALRRWLLAHQDQAKVLCMGTVLGWVEQAWVNDPALATRADGWAAYPWEWRWLVDVMVRHQIKHTLFLSGDFHFSGVAELQLHAKNHPPLKALSVVCSGWNASLPFINAKPEDFVLKQTVSWPGSDDRVRITSTAYSLGTALRQFSKLTLTPPDPTHKQGRLAITVFNEQGASISRWSGPC